MSEGNGVQGYRGTVIVSENPIRDSLIGSKHRIIVCVGNKNISNAEWAIDRLWATTLVEFGQIFSSELKSLIEHAKSSGLDIVQVETPERLMNLFSS